MRTRVASIIVATIGLLSCSAGPAHAGPDGSVVGTLTGPNGVCDGYYGPGDAVGSATIGRAKAAQTVEVTVSASSLTARQAYDVTIGETVLDGGRVGCGLTLVGRATAAANGKLKFSGLFTSTSGSHSFQVLVSPAGGGAQGYATEPLLVAVA